MDIDFNISLKPVAPAAVEPAIEGVGAVRAVTPTEAEGPKSVPQRLSKTGTGVDVSEVQRSIDETLSAVDFSRADVENVAARLNERVADRLGGYAEEPLLEPLPERRLQFSVSDETGRTIIKVFDKETGEVVREIPPDEATQMVERASPGNYLLTTTV